MMTHTEALNSTSCRNACVWRIISMMGLVLFLGGAAGCRKESPMTTAAKKYSPAEKEASASSRGSQIVGRSDLLSRKNVNNPELHLGLIHEDFQRYTEDLARSIEACDESPEEVRRKMTQLTFRLEEDLSTQEMIQLIEGTCKGGLKAHVYNDVLQRFWYDSPERLKEALRRMSPSVYRENGYKILNLRSASTPEELDKALDDYLMLTDVHDIRGALDGLANAKYNLINSKQASREELDEMIRVKLRDDDQLAKEEILNFP